MSRNFSGAVAGSVGSVQFQIVPCSNLYILLKIYRPLPIQLVLTTGISICCTCHFLSGSLCLFGFFCLLVSSVSNFCHDRRGQRQSLVQAHLFSCALGREEHCKHISLVCVGSARSISATLGLSPLRACVLSQSTLHRLQVALQSGPCTSQAPGPSSSGDQVLGERTLPRWQASASYHLSSPSRSDSWVAAGAPISSVLCVSSGELISGCDPPGRCQPSGIPGSLGQKLEACLQFDRGCHLWGRVYPFPALAGACLSPASIGGWTGPQPASFPLVFAQSFVL